MKNFYFAIIFCFFISGLAIGAEPMIWRVDSRAEVIKGDAKGVSISETGAISLSPRLSEIFKTEQSYVWSSAMDAAGNFYLGTGNDGKVFKVDAAGKGALLADLAELDVSAMAIGKEGSLFAATSPDGKVYRIAADGKAEVYFDPADKYIWSLIALADGSLIAGTGETGKIYKIKAANARPEDSLLFDSSDTHIISLAADSKGNFYAGTDSNGLVLKFGPDGKPFALLDAPLREIHEIAISPDGTIYALALSDSASASKPIGATVTAADGTTATVTAVEASQPEQPKSRYDLSQSKSAVFRMFPDGRSDIIWNSSSITAFSIYAHLNNNGVLIGTSDKGRIYNIPREGSETLILQSNEGQVSTIFTNGKQLFATSSNQGKLYRFGPETIAEGSYESGVRDAKTTALWGRIWWRASGPVEIQTRTGNTEKPDETWSGWSASLIDQKGGQIASPRARFMQWRALIKGGGILNDVSVSYLAQNIAPEVLSIQVSPTNVGLQANPPAPVDPNIEVSGLDPQVFGLPPASPIAPRKLYQRGARAITWNAEDRNGDKLEYSLFYKEAGEANFKLLRSGLKENFFSLDGLALSDGKYQFKVSASDSPSNPANMALAGEKTSETVEIDNSAPSISAVGAPQLSGDKARIIFEAIDSSSFISRAEYSIDGGDWKPVYADDGISDSGKERYSIEINLKEAGEYSVAIRVFDSQGNIGNARAIVKK